MLSKILDLLRRDSLQAQALRRCNEMLDLCERMVSAAVYSLRGKGEPPGEIDVYASDKILNSFEREVRRKVMTHLSLGNTADLTSGLVLVSVVIDLERIGDYSKNILDLANGYGRQLDAGGLEPELARIEGAVLDTFRCAAEAFRKGDPILARKAMEEYKSDVSAPYRGLEQRLVGGKESLEAADAVTLALYLRCLKRVGAHSRNLISSVVNPFDRIGYRE